LSRGWTCGIALVKLSTDGSQAFAVAPPHIWNTLPADMVIANGRRRGKFTAHLPSKRFFYSSNHILMSSFDITQLVILCHSKILFLIDRLIDWLIVVSRSREARSRAHLALGLGIGSVVLCIIIIGVYVGIVLNTPQY